MVFLVVNNGLITSNQQDEWISGWWFQTWMDYFFISYMGYIILPIDEIIFFRGLETTNQNSICDWMIKSQKNWLQFSKSPSKNCLKNWASIFPRNSWKTKATWEFIEQAWFPFPWEWSSGRFWKPFCEVERSTMLSMGIHPRTFDVIFQFANWNKFTRGYPHIFPWFPHIIPI